MNYCQTLHQQHGTYGTGLVTVSLKATLGFPITHGQLYSLSILYNTNQNPFIDYSLSPQKGKSDLFLKSNTKLDLLAWTVVACAHMTTEAIHTSCSYMKQCSTDGNKIFGRLLRWRLGFLHYVLGFH